MQFQYVIERIDLRVIKISRIILNELHFFALHANLIILIFSGFRSFPIFLLLLLLLLFLLFALIFLLLLEFFLIAVNNAIWLKQSFFES